jgi:outer membrane receptor for ferrienterochelin and colicin
LKLVNPQNEPINQMRINYKILLVLICLSSYGQTDSSDFFEMSLEDLLNVKVTVASANELTTRESPGIISVISEEEIKNSGAKDLMEVLKLVPGISFHQDVQGVVGIGLRGNWAHEGKVLLIIDGQEMNEILYSTLNFGNHYDVSSIKQIEIIRGPGSSIYGGYAELGVIKITSKTAEDLNGIQAAATYGQVRDSYARRNVLFGAGKKWTDGSIVFHGYAGQGQRSTAAFNDYFGNSSSMKNRFAADPMMANIGINFRKLSARFIYDYYKNTTVVWFDEALSSPITISYRNIFTELKYAMELGKKITITPKITYTNQLPWKYSDSENEEEFIIRASRTMGALQMNAQASNNISILAGTEYFIDNGFNRSAQSSPYFINGTDRIEYHNFASYAQLLIKNKIANVTVGGRYNHHSVFGSSFVPRVGITKVINDFHAKILYSYAYRAPSIENIVSNDEIKPENTQVLELEAGYQIGSHFFLTANAYDITIHDPIVYSFLQIDSANSLEYYENLNRTGTRGIEVESKMKFNWGYLNINYSYSDMAGKNKVDLYQIPNNQRTMLGFASHTWNASGSIKISKSLFINPSLSYIGKRGVVSGFDSSEVATFENIDPTWLINLSIRYKNILPGMEINAGIYDLLNQQYTYAQPYNSGLAPFIGNGREFFMRLSYSFKKK